MSKDVARKSEVVFMTAKDREMFPTKTSQDRFGNELCPLRGAAHRGPGCYENEDKTNFIHEIDAKLISTKGYTLGARTGPRFMQGYQMETPCPTEYQQQCTDSMTFDTSNKPFDVGADRFPLYKKDLIDVVPGVGTYEHEMSRNRKVQYHQSFGGSPILLPGITQRSTIDRNTGKLYSTKGESKYHRKLAYLKLYY